MVRTVAVRADDTEDPEMDPRMKKYCLPIKRGRERLVNIKNNLMSIWKYHSINGILRKKRKWKIILFAIGLMQSESYWTKSSKQRPR